MKKFILGVVLAGTLLLALVPPANAQYYRRSYYRPPYRGYVYQHRYYVPRPYYRPYRYYSSPYYYPGYSYSYYPRYYYRPAPVYYGPSWGISVWW